MRGKGMPYPMSQMTTRLMDQGTPMGMANAFTVGGTSRPVPGDFGPPALGGNAFMDPGTSVNAPVPAGMMPGYPPMTQPPMLAARATPAMMHPAAAQTVATVRESPYPSYRDMA